MAFGRKARADFACNELRWVSLGMQGTQSGLEADLLGAIYELPLVPDAWSNILNHLGRVFTCHFATSLQTTATRTRPRSMGSFGITGREHQDFLDTFHRDSPYGTRIPSERAGDLVLSRTILPRRDLVRTRMFEEFLKPRSLHDGLRLDILSEGSVRQSISLFRSARTEPFGRADMQLARLVIAHLRRAATLSWRLRSAQQMTDAALSALNIVDGAVLLLDVHGRVIYASADAERMLQAGCDIIAPQSRLAAAFPVVSGQFEALLAGAAGLGGITPLPGSLQMRRPDGSLGCMMLATPLPRSNMLLPGDPAVLVHLAKPAQQLPVDLSVRYGLTAAELALADRIVAGETLTQIAARSGRSLTTVRTHLAHLMAKTQTHRQSDLLRILLTAKGMA